MSLTRIVGSEFQEFVPREMPGMEGKKIMATHNRPIFSSMAKNELLKLLDVA